MSRPGFTFCVCPDPELLREYVHRELERLEPDSRVMTFWADEELPPAYWSHFQQRSLTGRTTALLLRRAEKLATNTWKSLNSLLNRHRRQVWPFFCIEAEWNGNKPPVPAGVVKLKCWRLAKSKGWIWQTPGLDRAGLRRYIQEWAEKRGIVVRQEFMQRAVNALPADAALVRRELDKLELWAWEGRELGGEEAALLSVEPETDVFAFLRSMQRGEKLTVWKRVIQGQMATDSAAFLPFLHLVLREARIMWRLLCGEDVFLPAAVKREKLQLARSMGLAGLSGLWSHVLEAEAGFKTGEWSQMQALDMLVANLEAAFAGPGGDGRRSRTPG
jgi:DNA polymerase-3 subunit delta